MKYFTKEWYELCQKTSFHLLLEEEKQAETFSEEYFQQLYNDKLKDWLDFQEEVASLMENDGTVNSDESEPFNREKAIEQFHDGFVYNQEYCKRGLPETILKQIVDIRVFTLDKATHTVINAVTKYCEENERSVKTISGNYRTYFEEASHTFGQEIIENFGFHDCTIIKSSRNGDSLTLLLDNTGGFTNIDEVTFENPTIVKQDSLLEGSWWLYDEIYIVDDKYELHVLLRNKNMELMDFIISADQVSFKDNAKDQL